MKLVKFKDYMDIIKGLIKKKVYNSLPATLNTGDMVLYKGALYQYFGENNTVVNLITEDNFILADLEHKVRIGKWVLADRIEYDEIYQRGLQLQDENYMYGKFVNTIRFDYGISEEGEISKINKEAPHGGATYNKGKTFVGYKDLLYINDTETTFYKYLTIDGYNSSYSSSSWFKGGTITEALIFELKVPYSTDFAYHMFSSKMDITYSQQNYWGGNGWKKDTTSLFASVIENIKNINETIEDPSYDLKHSSLGSIHKNRVVNRNISYINKIALPKYIFKISNNKFCDIFFSNKNIILMPLKESKLINAEGKFYQASHKNTSTDSDGRTSTSYTYDRNYNIKNATFKIFTDEREENYAIEQPSYKWRLNLYSHKLINQVGNNGYNDLNYGANEYGFAFVFNFKYDGLYRVTLQANITSKGQVWTGLEVHFGKDIVNDTDRLSYVRMAHREDLKLIFEVKKGKVISISLDTQAEYTGEAKKLIDNIVKTLYHYDIPGFGHLLSCTYVPHRIDDTGSWDELQIATLTAPLTVEKLI